ncbi:hypothetical protein SADUNF_Sadunf14G0086400 [Salix dunnii]|uniref:Uncharacterized protein n=1 Tax=Salix dunnii TaxID=1413687 RepID=A0A835MQ19_9ROSI|nr:hypothetical protein SADUNF_Sadunf14G0086400 [Salix dunnii]
MRNTWIPRLIERIQAESESPVDQPITSTPTCHSSQIDIPVAASESGSDLIDPNILPDISGSCTFSEYSLDAQISSGSDLTNSQNPPSSHYMQNGSCSYPDIDSVPWGWYENGVDKQGVDQGIYGFVGGGDSMENLWNEENIWSGPSLKEELSDETGSCGSLNLARVLE